ncbi:hypothetical protein MOUN0_A00100 [Monosporozyma unispora]
MISTKYISTLLIFLTTLTNVVLGGYSPAACHPMSGQTAGFNAKLYYYQYANLEYSHETEFLAGGYQSILTPGPVVTGVTDPFFKIVFSVVPFYPSWKSDNFSMELTGYYVAPQTGLYRLSYKVDDAGIIFFGSGAAFDCCTQETGYQSVNATIINQYDTKAPTNKELYLEAGYAYPIKIFFTNALYDAQNQLAVTLPDGTVDNNIGTSVYSSPDKLAANCDPIPIDHIEMEDAAKQHLS